MQVLHHATVSLAPPATLVFMDFWHDVCVEIVWAKLIIRGPKKLFSRVLKRSKVADLTKHVGDLGTRLLFSIYRLTISMGMMFSMYSSLL